MTRQAWQLLLGGAGPGPYPQPFPLRGQFVLETANPFATMRRSDGSLEFPGAKPDRFFLAEIDVLWDRNPGEAQRIVSQALAMGINHAMTGPVRADGYKGHYPDTNWFGRAARFAEFYRWLRSQMAVSMVVMTDIRPWYDVDRKAFDWPAITQFTDFYGQLAAEGVEFDRVVSQWEQWQPRDVCRPLFQWMASMFPHARRYWHNPVDPPHLSPGSGAEEERPTWESFLEFGHGMYLQADTADAYDKLKTAPYNADGRTTFGQMQYDLYDMRRRAIGDHSPWGGPLINCDGEPMEVIYAEGIAHFLYHDGGTQADARTWGQGALAVPGIVHSLDGIP